MGSFIRTLAARYDHGHDIGDHTHGWGQLIYASSGAIHVAAARQAWLIPSARAVWLPPGTPHRLRMRGITRLRTLYIPPLHCAALAPAPRGIMVSPLLRELLLELVRIGHIDANDRAAKHHARHRHAVCRQLPDDRTQTVWCPIPAARRARKR